MSDSTVPPKRTTRFPTTIATDEDCPGISGVATLASEPLPAKDETAPLVDIQPADQMHLDSADMSSGLWQQPKSKKPARVSNSTTPARETDSKPVKATKSGTAKAKSKVKPEQETPASERGTTSDPHAVDSTTPGTSVHPPANAATGGKLRMWADYSSSDDGFDPLPHVPGPTRGFSFSDLGDNSDAPEVELDNDDTSFDYDKVIFSDGNPSVLECGSMLYQWDEEKRSFIPASRATEIRKNGPRNAPGVWTLARVEIPERSILEEASFDNDIVQIKADRLEEHLATWREFHHTAPIPKLRKLVTSDKPDGNGMVTLSPAGVVELLARKEEDLRVLNEKNRQFRQRLADHVLREDRTQRYSLTFVQDQLEAAVKQHDELSQWSTDLGARERELRKKEESVNLAQEQSRFCDIAGIRSKLENMATSLEHLSKNSSLEDVAHEFETFKGAYVDKFVGYLDKIEKSKVAADEYFSRLQTKLVSADEAKAKSKKATAEAKALRTRCVKQSVEQKAEIDKAVEARMNLFMQTLQGDQVAELRKLVETHHLPKMEEVAYRKAQHRFIRVAKDDPQFVLQLAREACLNNKDNEFVRVHKKMMAAPMKKSGPAKDKGWKLGLWVAAQNAFRLKNPESPWYGAAEPDHELSLRAPVIDRKGTLATGTYWMGIDEGIAWAVANQDEAASLVIKVEL